MLITRALEELASNRFEQATVWSFASNQRANAFYEGQGFRRDGSVRTQAVWADVLQVRYRRPLHRP
jgi:ribosomal protein S18 acetylase RimI-like enzyme